MRSGVMLIAITVAALPAWLHAQSPAPADKSDLVIVDPDTAKWEHESNDPPGSESVVLREDRRTGALELLVRYPAGHVFKPHWHTANERIVLLEGRLSIEVGQTRKLLTPGGFAFLPAKQTQHLSCVSDTRCAFYVHWDGKLDFHRESAK